MSTVSHVSRRLQVASAIAVVPGFLPWSQLADNAVHGAIHSEQAALTLSVVAWLLLLLPLWVAWFALRAWEQRNVSCLPAVLMAVPSLLVTAITVLWYSAYLAT